MKTYTEVIFSPIYRTRTLPTGSMKGEYMKNFGYAECAKCKDQNGPWILDNNQFLCEDCYKRQKAVTLAGGDHEFAKRMRTHALSPSTGQIYHSSTRKEKS